MSRGSARSGRPAASPRFTRRTVRTTCPPKSPNGGGMSRAQAMVTIDDVRALASELPRAYEVLVRDRVKFRVGRIVFLAFSADETVMGCGFPKDEREALVA